MKKKFLVLLTAVTMLILYGSASVSAAGDATETITYRYNGGNWVHTREMEKLGRGLVAIRNGSRVYLSWRLLDSEDHRFGSAESNVSFNIYRNGSKVGTVEDKTNYTDTSAGTSYQVAPVVNGVEGAKCEAVSVQSTNYFDINVQRPADVSLPRIVSLKEYTDKNFNFIASKSAPSGDLSALYVADYPQYIVNDFHSEDTAYTTYSYTINDCSTADLDGDGEYEIILKWDCNGQDNSLRGVTGEVIIDAYKLDGTFMWRVNLGKNIRAGAHYTQFLVYDFDGDGKAEMICKTAPGSKGGDGNYVTKASSVEAIKEYTDDDNEEDYRNGEGYVLEGDEFLTVFDGETGNAVDTIYYPNQRVDASVWGDTGGNRVDRFTATVAYMDGVKPYGVFMRGYYMGRNGQQRQAACAVSFNGKTLECTHSFDTYNVDNYNRKYESSSYDSNYNYKGVDGYVSGNEKFVGQGNHNCSTADVDNDGKDEVITGALCYEFKDDGRLGVKWCTFLEHGDALHIGDYDPTHEGFEFFTIHEEGDDTNYKSGTAVTLDYGMSVIDPGIDCTDPSDEAYDDLIMFHEGAGGDTGRGMMGNFGMGGYYQFWSSGNELQYANGGKSFTQGSKSGVGVASNYNFRIFWNGDLYEELFDGTSRAFGSGRIWSWNGSSMSGIFTTSGCITNGTKNNPALTADLFGDWREELVMATSDNTKLRVYTTTTPSNYKIKTLMHDPVYRMGVAAEQTCYNQPPHVGMYLHEDMFKTITGLKITHLPNKTSYKQGESFEKEGLVVNATYSDGTSGVITRYNLSGFDSSEPGRKAVTVTCDGFKASFSVTVLSLRSISAESVKTFYSIGQRLNTGSITVTGAYSDGSKSNIPISECDITGFDSSQTGVCTVTVSYRENEATFNVNIVDDGCLQLINGTYETDSTESSNEVIEIGTYKDSFTLEHDVIANSMPANGSLSNDNNTGFFLRFMNIRNGAIYAVGSGWTLISNSDSISLYWKDGYTRETNFQTNLKIGEKYRFKYVFTNVGDNTGALVSLTVTDNDGNVIADNSGLAMRNFTSVDNGMKSAINAVQIFNQANANSTASVTISNAVIYGTGRIVSVLGNKITYSLNGAGNARLIAAKYSSGILTDLQFITLPNLTGEKKVVTADFEPDKVFMWAYDIYPIDAAEAGYDSGDDPEDNPGDDPTDEFPVSNSFDNTAGRIIMVDTTDTAPYTGVNGLTLYIGKRPGGTDASTNFSYETGGRTGNALVMNSGRFASGDRGPRFKINTPAMPDNGDIVAELYVKPMYGSGGRAALYYNDDTAIPATEELALTIGEWNKLTIRLTSEGGQVTRTIYVNDEEKASDKASTFPVFWGAAENETYSKLYFDDITVKAVE